MSPSLRTTTNLANNSARLRHTCKKLQGTSSLASPGTEYRTLPASLSTRRPDQTAVTCRAASSETATVEPQRGPAPNSDVPDTTMTVLTTPNDARQTSSITVPGYQSHDLRTGIMHFGVSNFARSHQMSYLEELLAKDFEHASKWAYTGIGVRDSSKRHQKQLGTQGYRYCIVKSDGSGEKQEVQVVGALRDVLVGTTAPGEIVRRIASKEVGIVSLTITEFGYTIPKSEQDGALLELAKQVKEDELAFGKADAKPEPYDGGTFMGYIIAGLKARQMQGHGGMTILSCDNIPHNGDHVRDKLMNRLEETDKDLKQWVEDNCTFPNCMVDSITPSTTEKMMTDLKDRHGIDDNHPVPREFFKQWVIEDKFAAGRPAWEKVGAQLVKDVTPFELTKIRMLNVVHSVIGMSGLMRKVELADIAEATADDYIDKLYKSVMQNELRPVLEKKDGVLENIDLDDYIDTLTTRFTEGLPDALTRIATDSSEKFRVQGVPAILDGLEAGLEMKGMALTVASWAHFIKNTMKNEEKLEDKRADQLTKAMDSGIEKFLGNEEIFEKLARNEEWKKSVKEMYDTIEKEGVEQVIDSMCTEQ